MSVISLDVRTERPIAMSRDGRITEMLLTAREQRLALVRAAGRRYHVPAAELLGPAMNHRAVDGRHHAMLLIRAYFGDSFPHIGRLFNRHHGTVMNGLARRFGWTAKRGDSRHGMGQMISDGLERHRELLIAEAHAAIEADNAAKIRARRARLAALAEEMRDAA